MTTLIEDLGDMVPSATTIQKYGRGYIVRATSAKLGRPPMLGELRGKNKEAVSTMTTIDTMPKGGLRFPGSSAKMALWGKVHADTPADMIVSLLKTICSEPPSAVFSVIGHFTPQRAANSPFAASADAVAP